MSVYLFFDESGDLHFAPQGSRYYFFGVLSTRDPVALTNPLSQLRYEVLSGGIELDRFHASEDRQAVRDRVFDVICSVGGFVFDCVVIEKAKANPALYDEARFYPQFSNYLLQYVFNRYTDPSERIVIVTDRLPVKKTKKAVEKVFKQYISGHFGPRPYTLVHHSSAGHACLQAADYCMWAVHRKWQNEDTRSYDLIRHFIRSEFEIFHTGTQRFY